MTARAWVIDTSVSGKEREINLVLYEDIEEMRADALSFSRQIGEEVPDDHYEHAAAVSHAYEMIDEETEEQQPEIGTLRFCVDYLNSMILAHESVHIAQWLYRLDVLGGESVELAVDHFDGGNEVFAHMVSVVFGAVLKTIESAT